MIVVTIARKPVDGSVARNAVRHSTGGMNIDGTRIRFTSDDDMWKGSTSKRPIYGGYMDGSGEDYRQPHHRPTLLSAAPNNAGRWPANLILEHRPSCRQIGTREARGGAGTFCPYWPGECTGHTGSDGGRVERSLNGPTRHGPPPPNWVPPARSETIPLWACAPDCPVAELDAQSGMSTTPTSVTRGKGTASVINFGAHQERIENVACYGDSGGASRFFKQIGGKP